MKIRIKGHLPQFLWQQFLEYFWWYIAGFIFLATTHYCQSNIPLIAKGIADKLALDTSSLDFNYLSPLALMAIGILFSRTLSRLLFFTPARLLERDVRLELMRRLEDCSPLRYRKFSSGQIFNILFSDMQQLRALIGFALLQVGNLLVAILILVPKLYQFNPALTLCYIPMVLAMTIMSYLTYSSQRFYRQAKDAHGDLQNTIVESYHGKKTIKNFQAEKSFVDLFREYCQKELKLFFRGSIAPSVSVPLIPLSVAISFVWGCYIIVQQNLGASAIILLSGFIFLFLEPMMFVGWIGIVITQSIGSWDRINELVKSIETEDGQEVKLRLNNDFQKKLNLHDHLKLNLPFWNLTSPVELTIWEFRWLVLVGRTGCGKTTLLQGIAEVLKRNHLKISFVGQESFIYNDSFQSNIFLGLTPNRQQLETAYYFLELFGLSNLTHSAASLWKMELGENGKQLSGGQCKRLALVRSLMSEAPYLLWDDPFSSVDYILEKEILVKLKAHPLIQKKTFVLTSHRLSTVKYCDYVVLLEKDVGILESGVTKELLSQGSKTNEYFQKQLV